MKTSLVLMLALFAAAADVHANVVVHDIGGGCGGVGDQAPAALAADNCWKGYECDHSKNLVCVRNSQWSWNCEVKGSIGPDGKPVKVDQCRPTEVVAPNGGRKLITESAAGVKESSELVVPLWGSCGGTGSQTPADRKAVNSCWANTRCAGEAICIQEDKAGTYYQCLPKGSKNYDDVPVFTDTCKH